MQVTDSRAGFSLIEAVIASVVLLGTCVTVSATLASAFNADRLLERRALLDEVLDSERARLAALPYCQTAAAPVTGLAWRPEPPSLLGEVFPHAVTSHNSAAGCYRADSSSGAFVTHSTSQGVDITSEARFVRRDGADWAPVPVASVAGWAIWETRPLPAATVEVRLTATLGPCTSSLRMILGALPPTIEAAATDGESSHVG